MRKNKTWKPGLIFLSGKEVTSVDKTNEKTILYFVVYTTEILSVME